MLGDISGTPGQTRSTSATEPIGPLARAGYRRDARAHCSHATGEARVTEPTQTSPVPDEPTRRRGPLAETRDSLRSVFANPRLRRVHLAPTGSMIGDWAYATAAAVWAYDA